MTLGKVQDRKYFQIGIQKKKGDEREKVLKLRVQRVEQKMFVKLENFSTIKLRIKIQTKSGNKK